MVAAEVRGSGGFRHQGASWWTNGEALKMSESQRFYHRFNPIATKHALGPTVLL